MKKLQIKISFYYKSSIKLEIEHISENIQKRVINSKILTCSDGFVIYSGYDFIYTRDSLTLPTYLPLNDYDETDLYTYYNFDDDDDRYESLKRLYGYLIELSQSKIFQYDNTGYISVQEDKWLVF